MHIIEEYITRTLEERQSHISFDESCIERGGNSTKYQGLLAVVLETTIPTGMKILLCHACYNEKCSNPKHLYWGTPKENCEDTKRAGKYKSPWQRTIDKYGIEEAKRIMGSDIRGVKRGSHGGKANKGIAKSPEHRKKLSESLKKKAHLKGIGIPI